MAKLAVSVHTPIYTISPDESGESVSMDGLMLYIVLYSYDYFIYYRTTLFYYFRYHRVCIYIPPHPSRGPYPFLLGFPAR